MHVLAQAIGLIYDEKREESVQDARIVIPKLNE